MSERKRCAGKLTGGELIDRQPVAKGFITPPDKNIAGFGEGDEIMIGSTQLLPVNVCPPV